MTPPDQIDWTPRDQPLGAPAAPVVPPAPAGHRNVLTPGGQRIVWTAADGPLPQGWQDLGEYPAATGVVPPPPRKSRTGLTLALLSIAAVLIIAVAITVIVLARQGSTPATTASPATTIIMNVDLVLVDSSGVLNIDDVHCTGMGGYDDMAKGGAVTVTDEHSTVVAATSLPDGLLRDSGLTRKCEFEFSVYGLPAGHPFYGLTVGHRDPRQIPAAEVADVELTLG